MRTINLSTILSIIQENIPSKDLKKNKTLLAYILKHMQENKLSQLGCFLSNDDAQPQPSVLALTTQYNILIDRVIILRPRRDLRNRKQPDEGGGDQTANIFERQPMQTGGHHAIILSCYQLHFKLDSIKIRYGLLTRKQPYLSYLNLKSTEKKIVRLCIDRLHNETPSITSHVLYEDFIKDELGKRKDRHKGIYNIDPKTTIMPLQTGQNGIDFFDTVSNRNHPSILQKN